MPVAGGQRDAHELAVRLLVGRVDLDEPLPLPTESQERDVA